MESFCHYHPTKATHWVCPKCDTNFCPGCVLEREKSGAGIKTGTIHLCPKCFVEAEWVGAANLIEPFWQRLPGFFAYPLKAQPLIFNLFLTVIVVLFGWVPFVKLFMGAALITYSYKILLNTIYGDMRPPSYDTLTDFSDIGPVIQQWVLFFILYFLAGTVFATAGIIGVIIYAIAAIFLLPVMIILLATSERLSHALNPVMFIGMVVRIGRGYLLMWFLLMLLFFAPSSLIYLAAKFLPPYLLVFIIQFAKNYYTFVSYFLMGYVILQYHEQLNYSIDFDQFHDPSSETEKPEGEKDPQQNIINQVELLTKEGKADDAIAYIKEAVGGAGITSLILLERFYRLLRLKKEIPEMLEQGRELLHQLIKDDQKEKVCSIYVECASADKNFQMTPRDLLKVAGWLHESGKNKGAVNALNKIIKFYPDDVLAPKAYFQLAQIYNEKLNDTLKSKKIIAVLAKKYPDHDIIPFARRYLDSIQA